MDERIATAWPGTTEAETIVVGPSPVHGRGVFAGRDLAAGEAVHVAPVVLLDDTEHELLASTALDGYVYDWADGGVALALGYGSLFNHAADPNCEYSLAPDDHPAWPALVYATRRVVPAGEELTVDYSGGEVDLWFDA